MYKKRDYNKIVVFLAQIENNPRITWEVCRRCANKYFKFVGFKSLDYCALKNSWRNFNNVPSRMP